MFEWTFSLCSLDSQQIQLHMSENLISKKCIEILEINQNLYNFRLGQVGKTGIKQLK